MNAGAVPASDDKLTMISMACVACALADIFHEGLGHGVTAWLSGAHRVTISTVAMQSDISTRLISASGTMANFLLALIFWLLLFKPRRLSPAVRYFFVLNLATNLLAGTGYFFFSGVASFGDWADVIAGLPHHWLLRLALIMIGAGAYYASMVLIARKLKPFHVSGANPRRLRGLCWIPYFTEAILSGLAGLLNPIGLFYVAASALASTLGGNCGFLNIPSMLRRQFAQEADEMGPILRSVPWIIVAAIASAFFIFVLGRGVTWRR